MGAQLIHVWSRVVMRLFGFDIRERSVSGPESGPRAPRVIVSNHLSYLDIPVLLSRGPCIFLGKKEIASWPLIGCIAKTAGIVLVDRDSLFGRARSLLELQTRLQSGMDVVIFPEGTTSLEGPVRGLSSFYQGAFRLARMEDALIELVYLDYDQSERCAWLGNDDFVSHLWSLLSSRGGCVRLRSAIIDTVVDRQSQRRASNYSRGWMLSGGRNLFDFPPMKQV